MNTAQEHKGIGETSKGDYGGIVHRGNVDKTVTFAQDMNKIAIN
jgi:hypothetical protein